ncbi:MAG: hypothetical protein AUF79_02820 [Crenarchaeota archaeon 13_1_20CM_2_51_8]|nr:MAG: hypothetical protein AUF79_02820 [Crenarchaeota archaeon 13_1_20CM_2_51_8]
MLSPKVFLFAYMLLAMSLLLVLDYGTLIEQELNGQVVPKLWSGNFDANRPMSMCISSAPGNTTSVVQRGDHGIHTCPVNFSLSLSQESLIQIQGSSSSVNALVTLVSGTPAIVTMSAQDVPAATEILFAPTSGRSSFSSAMTIATSAETPLGRFNMTVLATGGGLEKSAVLSLLVVPIVHDIAVVSVSVRAKAIVGSVVPINATVANYGSVSETFDVRAYVNATLIAGQSVPKLMPAAIYTIRLMWNTTGYSPGTYTILVAVPPVQGELNLLDNSREAAQVLLIQTPGSGPGPSPAASNGSAQGFTYGRQLAIVVAIAEVAMVFLLFLRRKEKGPTGNALVGTRKI